MIGNIERDQNGKALKATPSMFNPSQEVRDITVAVREDYEVGYEIMHSSYEEFNDKSVIQIMNLDQKAFNAYRPPRSNNPDESWRAQTVRSLTRAKVVSIAAHITATTLFPNVFAQNNEDKEDKEAAFVMRSLIEWVTRNSDYEESFLFAVISMCVNPAVYLKPEFAEVMQTIKKRAESGEITKEQVVDSVLSGFQTHVVPVDEILINNIYEYEIQRQKCLLRKRFITFDEAEALWGGHENFQYVSPGIKTIFSNDDGMFYDQKDDDHPTLVEEVTYYNRREDLEITFINGIIVTNVDERMKHRDQKDRPLYPFAKSGYEPIDEKRFFYYKSLVSKLGPDQELLDMMWNMTLDGTFLSLMPPQNVFSGDDRVDAGVVIPGASNFYNVNSRVEPMKLGSDINAGHVAIQSLESSMSENSQDPSRSGSAGDKVTASQFLGEERNARIALGLFGRMVANLVRDYGKLLVPLIVHNMSTAQVEELTGGDTRMKFRSFLLQNQTIGGKNVTQRIEFTDSLMGREMTPEEVKQAQFDLIDEEGGIKSKERIYRVNPFVWSQLDFMVYIDVDNLLPKNEQIEKAIKLEAYDRAINNPILDPEVVTREFLLEAIAPGEADKFIRQGQPEAAPQAGGGQSSSPIVQQLSNSGALTELTGQ